MFASWLIKFQFISRCNLYTSRILVFFIINMRIYQHLSIAIRCFMNLEVLSIECNFQFSLSEFVMFYVLEINISKFSFKNSKTYNRRMNPKKSQFIKSSFSTMQLVLCKSFSEQKENYIYPIFHFQYEIFNNLGKWDKLGFLYEWMPDSLKYNFCPWQSYLS